MPITKIRGRAVNFYGTAELLRKWEQERGLLSVPLHKAVFRADLATTNQRGR